jgi:hypothetical protein
MGVNKRIKPRRGHMAESGTWRGRLRFYSEHGWGEARADDALRSIYNPTVVQTAKMSITARPTRIPTMPRATLEALTGRSCPLDSSLRSTAVALPIRSTPSCPVNPATHRTNERIISATPMNHARTATPLPISSTHAALYQPNLSLDAEGWQSSLLQSRQMLPKWLLRHQGHPSYWRTDARAQDRDSSLIDMTSIQTRRTRTSIR